MESRDSLEALGGGETKTNLLAFRNILAPSMITDAPKEYPATVIWVLSIPGQRLITSSADLISFLSDLPPSWFPPLSPVPLKLNLRVAKPALPAAWQIAEITSSPICPLNEGWEWHAMIAGYGPDLSYGVDMIPSSKVPLLLKAIDVIDIYRIPRKKSEARSPKTDSCPLKKWSAPVSISDWHGFVNRADRKLN